MTWIDDEHFTVHFTPAIAPNDDGSRRSIWPEKWSLEFLESIEHTRQYAKNYALSPLGLDGAYWTDDDFVRAPLAGITRVVLSIDPAVTTKDSSDFTGLAVVGWSPSENACRVEYASQVKLSMGDIRLEAIRLIELFEVGLVLIETNQGGDVVRDALWGLPIRVKTVHQTVRKEVRAAEVLNEYQRHRVVHAPGLTVLEGQMVAFPRAPHDDMVDAVGSAIRYFLRRPKSKRVEVGGESVAYA